MSDTSGGIPLQFDTAMPRGGTMAAERPALACKACNRPITSTYYDVSGESMCAECRTKIGASLETPTGAGPLVKAGIFGIVAGIAGAIVYYGVIAITNFEIGIVAILIGYMVGYGVRMGAGGGGRRFQVMAVAFTYMAVALAYTPLLFKAAFEHRRKEAAVHARTTGAAGDTGTVGDSGTAGDSSTPDESAPASDSGSGTPRRSGTASVAAAAEQRESRASGNPLFGLVLLLGLIAALPVLSIIGSMPSGFISALIIFFGMKQAWKMTGASGIVITGPYRVGVPRTTSV